MSVGCESLIPPSNCVRSVQAWQHTHIRHYDRGKRDNKSATLYSCAKGLPERHRERETERAYLILSKMGPRRRESSCCSTRASLMLVSLWCCYYRVSSFSLGPSAFLGGAQLSASRPTGTTPMSASQAAVVSTSTTVVMSSGSQRGRKREKFRRAFRQTSLHAAQARGKWGSEVWDKLKVPPDGRAHDEVTFRSGFEGEALTIPQGWCVLSMRLRITQSCHLVIVCDFFFIRIILQVGMRSTVSRCSRTCVPVSICAPPRCYASSSTPPS